jgi:hypothetical protein
MVKTTFAKAPTSSAAGATHRLNRDMRKCFGDRTDTMEELASAFLRGGYRSRRSHAAKIPVISLVGWKP